MRLYLLLAFINNIILAAYAGWIFGKEKVKVNCTSSQFKCNDRECIVNSKRCDDYSDCTDGEDELDCPLTTCPITWFKCQNGRCIDPDFKCDGLDHCGDRSDESSCSVQDLSQCGENSFRCLDKSLECVGHQDKCDGIEDCEDGSDELNCGLPKCDHDEFLCLNNKLCISKNQVCDGYLDCEDESDEADKLCHVAERCEKVAGSFLCSDNKDCIDISKVCNNKQDCSDGSDEPKNCTICSKLSCTDGCAPVNGTMSCVCTHGFSLDNNGKSCVDVDECLTTSDWQKKCSQVCKNTFGSYTCTCINGYELEPDGHDCRAKGEEPLLLFSTAASITQLELNSGDTSSFRTDLQGVSALATDSQERIVFWASTSDKMVYKARIDEYILHRKSPIITVGLMSPIGLGYDWIGQNLYILDSGRNSIIVCKPDGDICSVILDHLVSPTSMAVDSHNRSLYIAETGNKRLISKSWLDGSNKKPFVVESLGKPSCLTIDYTIGKLFWTDVDYNIISSIRFDGTDRQIVLAHEVKKPSLLVIFQNTMVWSNQMKHTLWSAGKLKGRDRKLLIDYKPITTAATILHPALQTTDKFGSPCQLKKCSHICLLSKNENGYTCACPIAYQLMVDQQTCQRKNSSKMLLVAHHSDILKFSLDYIGGDPYTTLASDDGDIEALTYDPVTKSIIHSTVEYDQAIICTSPLDDHHIHHKHQVLVRGNIKKISAIAMDWVARNVFWIDSIKRSLEVSRIDKPVRAMLMQADKMDHLVGLVLNLQKGNLFISYWGNSSRIDMCDMDGQKCKPLITKRLEEPNHLTLDLKSKRLYWTDSKLGEISSVALNGQKRVTHTVSTEKPMSLAVVNDMIYWTDWWTDALAALNLTSNKQHILHSGMDSMIGLTIIQQTTQVDNGCSTNNGGCSDICIAKSNQAKVCLCPSEQVLDEDEKTCLQTKVNLEISCLPEEMKCTVKSICLKPSQICDDFIDCPNEIDEQNCPSNCSSNHFRCSDGKCILLSLKCDGTKDCVDGSDELDAHCAGDLCKEINGNCSHTCKLVKGKAVCSCFSNYQLAEDKKSCLVKGVRPYLIVGNGNGIHRISTTGQTIKTDLLVSTSTPVQLLDIIMDTGTIIWSTSKPTESKSIIYTLTGNKSHVLLDVKGNINGLVVDWINRNVYYAGDTDIGCCDVDKLQCTTIFSQPNTKPSSITLDPLKGLMYWVDQKDDSIMMGWMDGTNQTHLIESIMHSSVSLVLDYVKNTLYWIDDFTSWIDSVELDGKQKEVRTLRDDMLVEAKYLDVFENIGYVSDNIGIGRLGLYYGGMTTMSRIIKPMGLKIVHPLKQSPGKSDCKHQACQYLCVVVPAGIRCLCPDFFTLDPKDNLCYDDASGKPYHPALSDSSVIEEGHAVHIHLATTRTTTTTSKPNQNQTQDCTLNCLNGGTCLITPDTVECSCVTGYNGTNCEQKLNTTTTLGTSLTDNGGDKLWILGLVLGLVLIVVFIAGLVYYLRSKNKDVSLVSMIKYRNPNLDKDNEEVEELVPQISFNNPGFQECDDKPPLKPRVARNLYHFNTRNPTALL